MLPLSSLKSPLARLAVLLVWLSAFLSPARGQVIDTLVGNPGTVDVQNPRQLPLVIPRAVAMDPSGAYLYIGDDGTRTVHRIDLRNNTSTVVAGGGTQIDDFTSVPGRAVALVSPVALAVDGGGNVLIVDDTNNRVRRLSIDGRVTTVAGNGVQGYAGDGGPAVRGQLALPGSIAVDRAGNIYIGDRLSGTVRRVDRFTGVITTIAGDPDAGMVGDNLPARDVFFRDIGAVAVDPQGNILIADSVYNLLYRLDQQSGQVRLVSGIFNEPPVFLYGDGGPAKDAMLDSPQGLAVAPNGDIYMGTLGAVRKISAATGVISTLVGGGEFLLGENRDGRSVILASGVGQLALTPENDRLYFATGGDHVIAQLNLQNNIFNILAGSITAVGDNGPAAGGVLGQPEKLALDRSGNLYVADFFHHRIRKITRGAAGVGTGQISTIAGTGVRTSSIVNGPAASTPIGFPRGVAVAGNGDILFTDSFRVIRRLNSSGNVVTVAGDGVRGYSGDGGPALSAHLNDPYAIISDGFGNLYIADTENHRVRKVDASGIITTIVGTGRPGDGGSDGEPGLSYQLNRPTDLYLFGESLGLPILFVVDHDNHRVLAQFLQTGETYIAAILFGEVGGITMDARGQIYIGGLNRILRGNFETLTLDTIAGDGRAGFSGDGGLATLARLSYVEGLVVDEQNNLLFTDTVSNRIRRISGERVVPVLNASPAALTFNTTQGATAPPAQDLTIGTSNLAPALWSATAQTLDASGWLKLGATSGLTPAQLAVSVDASRLAPGLYAGQIVVSAPGAANSPITISVSLSVSAALAPRLDAGPRQLTFRAVQGSPDPLTQYAVINNSGGGVLRYSSTVLTASGQSWLSVDSGGSNGPGLVAVKATAGTLPPGTYQGAVRFVNQALGSDSETIAVSLVIEPARPVLQVSQTTMVFNASAQSSFIPAQPLLVVNSGTGSLNWSASVTPLSGGDWLLLSVAGGTARPGASSRVNLSASPVSAGQSLSPGVYDALVTITSPGAANSPQVVLGRLRVQSENARPLPTVQPGGMVFAAAAGDARTRTGVLNIASSGGGALNFNAAVSTEDGAPWLVLNANTTDPLLRSSTLAGTIVSSADSTQLAVQVLPGGLAPGAYRGHITLLFSSRENGGAAVSSSEVGVLLVIAPAGAALRAVGEVSTQATLPPRAECAPARLLPQITSFTSNLQLPVGWPAGIRATVVDNCGSLIPRASVVATIVPPAPPTASPLPPRVEPEYVTLQPLGDGQYSANYSLARPGDYTIFVTAAAGGVQAGQSDTLIAKSTVSPADSPTPAVGRDGVVSGASFQSFASVAPGQIVSVFGNHLAPATGSAQGTPLPTELSGVSVYLGSQRMPLYYSGDAQLNAQVPFELAAGNQLPLLVTTGGRASPPEIVTVARSSPGLFTVNQSGQGAGVITDAVGRPLSADNPAHRGDVIIAYGTGFGLTEPPVPSGSVAPADPPARATLAVRAQMGGVSAPVEFAGLTPGYVGLYQLNIRVPADAPLGAAVELTVEQDGVASPPVTLPIQ